MDRLPDATPEAGEAKPFMEHLDELRQMLVRCSIALVVGMAVALPFTPRIFALLKAPLDRAIDRPDLFLQSIEITGAFTVTMRIALWSGVLLSAPFLLYFIGSFVFPGLKPVEKQVIVRSGGFSVSLFALGVWLGYRYTLPLGLQMMFGMHDWLGIQPVPQVSSYVAFAIQILIAFGLAFQMPVVVLILGRLGILTSTQLRRRRAYVIVVLLIVAMLITPPDVFTQLMMAVPLILLYEACVWMVWFSERRTA